MKVDIVPITCIEVGKRFREDYGDMPMLKESIRQDGIIQPLAVCTSAEEGKYELLAGGRRFKACIELGITEVPIRIYDKDMSELEKRSIELMENIIRKDLSWIEANELKEAIHSLQIQIHGAKKQNVPGGWGTKETAELFGVSKSSIIGDLKLAEAIKAFPMLKKADTEHDARKMLDKLKGELVARELASRMEKKLATTPVEVQRTELINAYMIGDFFDNVKNVPSGSIDLVEIDPPYAIDLDAYRAEKQNNPTSTMRYKEVEVDRYMPFLNSLFEETYRCMSDNSWCICWFAMEPWFEFVYTAMRRVGLVGSRIAGMWYKGEGVGSTLRPDVNLGSGYEPFFYMRKGHPSIMRQGRQNVFMYKPVFSANKVHPTERPIELMQDILQTFGHMGANVLVPFLGSGNTLLAAANLNMKAFGFDLSPEYKSEYILKVGSNRAPGYKSYKEVVNE